MSMNVLMVYPNRFKPHVAPVGLEYVCNSLRWAGIPFGLIDLNFAGVKEIRRAVRNGAADLVGISIRNVDANYLLKNEFFIPPLRDLIHRIKQESSCKVVLGGSGFSLFPREILSFTGADYGVAGYGEKAMPELVRALESGGDLARIDNLVWRRQDGIQVNRQSKQGYESLPPHRRDIVRNYDYYRVCSSGSIEAKRGCYQCCGYCAEPVIVGAQVAAHAVENVLAELKELRALGIANVHFCDSEFNVGPPDFIDRLCRAMIDQRLDMAWSAFLHPDAKSMSLDRLRLMKAAGCREVSMSVDSGSDLILEGMEKKHTVEDVIVLSGWLREAGIQLCQTYLIGWPGETTETIRQSIELMKRTRPAMGLVFAGIRIVPHTRLETIAREQGLIPAGGDLLVPAFVNPDRVVREFMPCLRRLARDVPNCVLPDRFVDFYNIVLQNAFLRGYRGTYAEFADYVRGLPLGSKAALLARSVAEYAWPLRRQRIPST